MLRFSRSKARGKTRWSLSTGSTLTDHSLAIPKMFARSKEQVHTSNASAVNLRTLHQGWALISPFDQVVQSVSQADHCRCSNARSMIVKHRVMVER